MLLLVLDDLDGFEKQSWYLWCLGVSDPFSG